MSVERRKGELVGLLGESVKWVEGVFENGRAVRGVEGVVRFWGDLLVCCWFGD